MPIRVCLHYVTTYGLLFWVILLKWCSEKLPEPNQFPIFYRPWRLSIGMFLQNISPIGLFFTMLGLIWNAFLGNFTEITQIPQPNHYYLSPNHFPPQPEECPWVWFCKILAQSDIFSSQPRVHNKWPSKVQKVWRKKNKQTKKQKQNKNKTKKKSASP